MRIGLTCTTIEPALTHGKIDGIGTYTKTLYEQFLLWNLSVTPYSFPKMNHWIKSSGFPNGRVFPLPFEIARFLPFSPRLKNTIDFLHVTDHLIPPVTDVPLIATIHDTLMFKTPEWKGSTLQGFKNWLRNRTTRWVKHFITITHAMVPELIADLGIKEENISVVHNGISPWWSETVSVEEKQRVRNKFKIPEHFLLHTSTLQPRKNIPRLIEAYLQLPKDIRDNYPLILVGKLGWDTEETLKAIHHLTSQKAGLWLNYIDENELRALFQSATLYLTPSLHEGFGRTILEAFASNTPVITSNLAGMPEVAGDAAYLIDPYSTNDLKEGMQKLLTNQILRQALAAKGKERVKIFTLEKCARETLKVYEKIASF